MKTISPIIIKDDRTGKTYAMSIYSDEHRDFALKKLHERMDYDYFESLPAKERANKKKHDLDFTCPFCMKKTDIASRKEKITSGFLFWFRTDLVDIFRCSKCGKEFMGKDLRCEIERKRRENNVIENFENWKDAKAQGKNPPEFLSIDKVDEFIISDFTPHPSR